jgi:CRISP-associated protein Cas1
MYPSCVERSAVAFRSVTVASEADIRLRGGQLVVAGDQTVTVPIQDIVSLTLEHAHTRVSAAALAALSGAGVPVVVCDNRHMPVGVLNGFCTHSRQFAVAKAQIGMSVPLKKRLWQAIVRVKANNQAACLDALGLAGADNLRQYARCVTSGDATGREAAAARLYFSRLMPDERRHGTGSLNGALDYGYAVARASICRMLVGHGFYPTLGIHHINEFNAFNLGDDLLEPFRPFVDLLAYSSTADISTKDGRRVMAGVLNQPCSIGSEGHSVLTAAERMVVSFLGAVTSGEWRGLELPDLAHSSALRFENLPES